MFNSHILGLFFPKYIEYSQLLVKISFVGLIFMIIQPLVFILIYNNKVAFIRLINFIQYLSIVGVYLLPFVLNT